MVVAPTPDEFDQVGTTDVSRRHLLEQFAERLQRRGVHNPDVAAVVSAARAEAFLADFEAERPELTPLAGMNEHGGFDLRHDRPTRP